MSPNMYQIAKALGCAYSTLRRWQRSASFPPTYRCDIPGGRKRRVMIKIDFVRWILSTGRVEGT